VSLVVAFSLSRALVIAHQSDNEVKHEDLECATGQYKDDPSVVLVAASVKVANRNSVNVLQHCYVASCLVTFLILDEAISII